MSPAHLVLALAAFAVGLLAFAYRADEGPLAPGDRIREFTLPDTEGRAQASSQWAGRVRVVNFWATWCPPCRREIPALVGLQQDYGARGLQVIGIAMEDAASVAAFAREAGIDYPLLVGEQAVAELATALGNPHGALPYTVVIDRGGRIAHQQAGEVTRERLVPILEGLL
jgi:peroxiredoxin